MFDFGPLLIGKDFEKRHTDKCKINAAELHISNAGNYALHVDFFLRSQSEEFKSDNKSPFYFEPASMDIPVRNEEPFHLKMWALPDKPIDYKDCLICVIKDNPKPVLFYLSCIGSEPTAEADSDLLEFEKLLVGQNASKVLKIKNTGKIKINWELAGIDKLPTQFKLSPAEGKGMLKPGEATDIQIEFTATEQKQYEQEITLLVNDEETNDLKQQPKPIKIKAESYVISVAPRFPVEGKMELDFGAVRVGEVAERKMYLKNNGLYAVNYRFIMKSKEFRERFTISEMKGSMEAEEEKEITIRFKSKTGWEKSSQSDAAGILVHVMEGQGETERESIPIKVTVKAVYSQFSISPVKGINFGPLQYGEQKSQTFEIKNDGKFDFNFNIYDFADEAAKTEAKAQREKEIEELGKVEEVEPEAKGRKPEKKEKKEEKKAAAKTGGKGGKDIDAGLKIGQFSISPSSGDIAPGTSALIKVTFDAEAEKFYEKILAIDISNRNYSESPDGLQYQLVGESCVPGINIEDVQSIFEEQMVISSFDPSATNVQSVVSKSIFALEENVFWFGTLIPSRDTKGQVEKFKISNPNKIPCTVKFTVKPRTTSKSEGFAFAVSPEAMKILPHEHNYVKVSFTPTNIMSYGGVFEAIVENGDPKSKGGKLRFELRGEGVLPTVIMEKPTTLTEDGKTMLKFKKTRLGNSSKDSIVLKNEGSVVATVQFEPFKSEIFNMLSPTTASIAPKSYQSFDISFEPKEIKEDYSYEVNFSTLHNPYEMQKSTIVGRRLY